MHYHGGRRLCILGAVLGRLSRLIVNEMSTKVKLCTKRLRNRRREENKKRESACLYLYDVMFNDRDDSLAKAWTLGGANQKVLIGSTATYQETRNKTLKILR